MNDVESEDAVHTHQGEAVVVELRKKELIEQAAARADIKKGDMRAAAEALLDVIADAVDSGRSLNLPPLGKVRSVRTKPGESATIHTLKLRRKNAAPSDSE